MRTFPFDVRSSFLAYLITITRTDETIVRMTTCQVPLQVDDIWFYPVPGLKCGDVVESNDGTPSSFSFSTAMQIGGAFDPMEVADGKFDAAKVEVDLCDAFNPFNNAFHFYGEVGNIDTTILGSATFDVRSPFSYPRNIFIGVFTLMCATDFASQDCRIPAMRPVREDSEFVRAGDGRRIQFGSAGTPEDYNGVYMEAQNAGTTAASQPSFSSTPGDSTVDGGVTWIARTAWEQPAQIATVIDAHNFTLDRLPDSRASDNAYYTPGRLWLRSGYSKNRSARIGRYDVATLKVTTYLPIGLVIDPGDWLFIWPDCDKTMEMCATKYSNANNYQGFVYQLGAKAAAMQGLL